MGDFPFLDYLSLKYLDISAETKHWTDYLKAHGLANACLARDPTREDIKRRIYDLERHWYHGSHSKTYTEHQQEIAGHKSQLRKLRERTEHKLDELDPMIAMHAKWNTEIKDLFSLGNIVQLLALSQKVFSMSRSCTDDLVEFSQTIIRSSMELLEQPPCPFVVIGLGSIARGEATPYSDLEYGFLVESGFSNHKYFIDLAVESYFRIGNLGESPLKCFNIKELNVKNEVGEKLFVDQPPVNGFKIDGISPKAGNIPTGHGTAGGKRLILTAEELMALYSESLMDPPDPDVPGDMSDLLSSPVLIFGHMGGEKLLDQFMAKRTAYETSTASSCLHATKKRLGTLLSDIDNHSFIPEFSFDKLKSLEIHVKADIFRYPTLLATNIKIILNADTRYPWETFQWLYDENLLSANSHAYLDIVLGLSIFTRTKAYTVLGSQHEQLSLEPTDMSLTATPKDRFHVPPNIFLTLGCMLVQMKNCIKKTIAEARICGEPSRDTMFIIVYLMLRDFIVRDDFMLKAEVLNYMRSYNKGLMVVSKAIGDSSVNQVVEFEQAISKEYQIQRSDPYMKKAFKIMASLLYEVFRLDTASDYLQWLSFHCETDGERLPLDLHCGLIMIELGKFEDAEFLLKRVESAVRSILSIDAGVSLPDYAISCLEEPSHDESLSSGAVYVGSIIYELYRSVADVREGLGSDYSQVLQDLNHAEDVLLVLSKNGFEARRKLADISNSRGKIYNHAGKFDKSAQCYERAITLTKSLFGSHAATVEIGTQYSNIADTYVLMGEFAKAEEYAQQAMLINGQLLGHNHSHTLLQLKILGDIYYHQGKYPEALKQLKRAFSSLPINWFLQSISDIFNSMDEYTSAFNILSAYTPVDLLKTPLGLLVMLSYDASMYTRYLPSVMRSVQQKPGKQNQMEAMLCIGKVCMTLGEYTMALDYFSASFSCRYNAFFCYQDLLLSLSKVWIYLRQYRTAVQFATLVLRSEGETPELHLGEAHYIIGDCYMRLEMYNKSWSHLHSALCLYQNLPKYRNIVLIIAKIHLSIAMLLFKLFRIFESLDHVRKAVKFADDLIFDQEKTTRECLDINEFAIILRDTLSLIISCQGHIVKSVSKPREKMTSSCACILL